DLLEELLEAQIHRRAVDRVVRGDEEGVDLTGLDGLREGLEARRPGREAREDRLGEAHRGADATELLGDGVGQRVDRRRLTLTGEHDALEADRKSTRLNSSHVKISY